MRISEAASYLGVSNATLRRWDRLNILKPVRTPGRHRRYSLTKLQHFFAPPKDEAPKNFKEKHLLCYARVSSHKQKQKGDLMRQIDVLRGGFGEFEYGEKVELDLIYHKKAEQGLGTRFFKKVIHIFKSHPNIIFLSEIDI